MIPISTVKVNTILANPLNHCKEQNITLEKKKTEKDYLLTLEKYRPKENNN